MNKIHDQPESKKDKKNRQSEQERYQNDENQSWNELDDMEQKNLDNFNRDNESVSEEEQKQKKPKPNPKKKKAKQIQEYQLALMKLRTEASKEFCDPFRKQKLNISLMPARKVSYFLIQMLFDAWQKQKDYVNTLRNLGIKTRMRVRNKSAVQNLLEWMLNYMESGKLPELFTNHHYELLKKDDSQFDILM